jgi:hypothetical protein
MEYYNVTYIDDFISHELSDQLLNYCDNHFDKLNIRTCHLFGDKDLIYKTTYQNKTTYNYTQDWDTFPDLSTVKQKLEQYINIKFNFCAIMMYANENIIIKKHRDKEIPNDVPICGISLGSTRRLQLTFKNKYTKILMLKHGSLYILHLPTNQYWLHEILPEDEPTGVRFSLTLRCIENAMSINDIKYCQALLKSGKRKGHRCECIAYQGQYCGKHKSSDDGYQLQLLKL